MKNFIIKLMLIPSFMLRNGLLETNAQALNDQAVWHYQTEYAVSSIPCDIGYQKLEIIEDTLIQGYTCKIVSKTNSKPVVNDTV